MAGHLVTSGYHVCAYNRSPARAEAWVGRYGGTLCATPADAASNADLVGHIRRVASQRHDDLVGGDVKVREARMRKQDIR